MSLCVKEPAYVERVGKKFRAKFKMAKATRTEAMKYENCWLHEFDVEIIGDTGDENSGGEMTSTMIL